MASITLKGSQLIQHHVSGRIYTQRHIISLWESLCFIGAVLAAQRCGRAPRSARGHTFYALTHTNSRTTSWNLVMMRQRCRGLKWASGILCTHTEIRRAKPSYFTTHTLRYTAHKSSSEALWHQRQHVWDFKMSYLGNESWELIYS